MSTSEEEKTIIQLKKEKKEKKPLTEEAKLVRAENIKKAQLARQKQYEERLKMKKVENNIKNIFVEDDDTIIIPDKPKFKPESAKIEEPKNGGSKDPDLFNMIDKMNKRIEKLYTMKKMKLQTPKSVQPVQPIIIDDTKKNNLLESIKAKMYNQY